MIGGASTVTTVGYRGMRRGEYIGFCGEGIYPTSHRITAVSPDRSTLTTRPVGRWEPARRFFEDYVKWPLSDFDSWLTAKVRGPWTCLIVGHRPSQRQYPDGRPMFSMRNRVCTRCHQLPRKPQ